MVLSVAPLEHRLKIEQVTFLIRESFSILLGHKKDVSIIL